MMLVQVALRAMMAGNVACFMTACIAGLSLLAKMKYIKHKQHYYNLTVLYRT
jgi:hypothetical protein